MLSHSCWLQCSILLLLLRPVQLLLLLLLNLVAAAFPAVAVLVSAAAIVSVADCQRFVTAGWIDAAASRYD